MKRKTKKKVLKIKHPNNHFHAYMLLGLMIGVLSIGTFGYVIIEGYRILDAFYMTVITVGTVGFREIEPLSDGGKIFTAILIIISLGSFGYVISTFTKYIAEGLFKNYFQFSKMKNKISKLNGHIIVCGYGQNGSETVHELLEHNEDVLIIEKDPERIQQIQNNPNLYFIEGDATRETVLTESNITSAKALISAMPNDADNLYIVLTAKELNNKLTIVSRASDEHSIKKLKRAGANNVIMPDKIGGNRMAKLVVQPDIVEFMEFIFLQQRSDVKVEEVSCSHSVFINKSILEMDVRNASGANIIGIRSTDGSYTYNPPASTIINADDKLFVLGSPIQVENLRDVLRGFIK